MIRSTKNAIEIKLFYFLFICFCLFVVFDENMPTKVVVYGHRLVTFPVTINEY